MSNVKLKVQCVTLRRLKKMDYFDRVCLTLTLSTNEPESLGAGTGVATCRVDADLGGVTVMRVCLTFINVWKKRGNVNISVSSKPSQRQTYATAEPSRQPWP